MIQEQLAFEDPQATPEPPGRAGGPGVRHREALLGFLDEVTDRVRETSALGGVRTPADPRARAALRHTVRNAQLIGARARRAIEALPGTDLELLRAHGRLVAATREADEARRTAEWTQASGITGAARGMGPSVLGADSGPS